MQILLEIMKSFNVVALKREIVVSYTTMTIPFCMKKRHFEANSHIINIQCTCDVWIDHKKVQKIFMLIDYAT